VPKAVQTNFASIIHPSISNHCMGVEVSDTENYALFWTGFFKQIISQMVAIGVVGGLNIGVLNGEGRKIEYRDQVIVLCGSSLHTNPSKLVISLLESCL